MLAAPGVFPGVFVAGILEGNPHGGGNSAVILLIATPINLGLYTGLALGAMKIFQRISRTRRRRIET